MAAQLSHIAGATTPFLQALQSVWPPFNKIFGGKPAPARFFLLRVLLANFATATTLNWPILKTKGTKAVAAVSQDDQAGAVAMVNESFHWAFVEVLLLDSVFVFLDSKRRYPLLWAAGRQPC
jgi:hypothetical protein